MTNTDEVSDLTKHLVLYAKSHYRTSDDVLKDIWTIISMWSWGDPTLRLEKESILYGLTRMVKECNVPEHWIMDAEKSLWKGDYARPWTNGPLVKESVTFVEYVHSRLSMVRLLPITQLPWLPGTEADEKYLPISANTLVRRKEKEMLAKLIVTREALRISFSYPETLTEAVAIALQSHAGYHPSGYGFDYFKATETSSTWSCSTSCD